MNQNRKDGKIVILAAAAALFLFLPRAAWSNPSIYGFNFPCWGVDCYQAPVANQSLQALAQTGARWIAVTPTWYMDSSRGSLMRPTQSTPSDESLRAVIRQAKALGLLVTIKPHVDLEDGRPRSSIDPKNSAAWFANYRVMILHYAQLAAEEHADLFVVGTELFHLDGLAHRRDWKSLIAAVRDAYSGPLTYAANCYDFAGVSFWDQLDYIGIDGYFPILGGDDEKALRLGWEAYKPVIAAVSHAYGKPIIFTEIGISSQKGANLRPWDFTDFGALDLHVQQAYLGSFLSVFSQEKWFAGFLQWDWEAEPASVGPQDKSQSVRGKPALEILERYFKLWSGGQAAAPSAVPKIRAQGARALGLIPRNVFDGGL